VRKVGSGFAGTAEDIEGLMLFAQDEVEDVTIITDGDGDEVVDVEEFTCRFLVEATS
jgi:hypothetical protein